MMKIVSMLILILIVLSLPGQCLATLYRWVDAQGVITIRDTPPPPGVKAQVFPSSDSADAKRSADDAAKARSRSMPKVEIYMTEWCPTCKHAINYLNSLGIEYTKYDIDKDPKANERFHSFYRQTGVPFTLIGEERILGFSKSRFDAALGIGKKN